MREQRQWSECILSCQRSLRLHQGFALSPFLFALVVDVVSELAREDVLSEFLYADDLVLMSETMEGPTNNLINGRKPSRARV